MEADISLFPVKTVQYLSLQLLSYILARILHSYLWQAVGSSLAGLFSAGQSDMNDVLPSWLETVVV